MTKVFPRAPHLWNLGFSCPLKWGRRQWFSFCFCHKEVAALTSILAYLAPFYWAHHSSRRTSVWDEDGGRSPTLWQGSQVPPWNTLEVASWWWGLFSVTVQHGCETRTFFLTPSLPSQIGKLAPQQWWPLNSHLGLQNPSLGTMEAASPSGLLRGLFMVLRPSASIALALR